MILLHVLDTIRETTFKEIHVRCSDTDVLVLLMDLASSNRLGPLTELIMLTGVGAKYREIDVQQRTEAVGVLKAQGLIGLHNFSRADWGGKFVGVSKKTLVQTFLCLSDDDDIVECIRKLGCVELCNIKMDSSDYRVNSKSWSLLFTSLTHQILVHYCCHLSDRKCFVPEIYKESCCHLLMQPFFLTYRGRIKSAKETSHMFIQSQPCQR